MVGSDTPTIVSSIRTMASPHPIAASIHHLRLVSLITPAAAYDARPLSGSMRPVTDSWVHLTSFVSGASHTTGRLYARM